jgi:hypothetical protein
MISASSGEDRRVGRLSRISRLELERRLAYGKADDGPTFCPTE